MCGANKTLNRFECKNLCMGSTMKMFWVVSAGGRLGYSTLITREVSLISCSVAFHPTDSFSLGFSYQAPERERESKYPHINMCSVRAILSKNVRSAFVVCYEAIPMLLKHIALCGGQ